LGAQNGVPPLHDVVHDPHVPGCERSVSQPLFGSFEQCAYPAWQDDGGTSHAPPAPHVTVPLTWGSVVQSCPHAPQLRGSVLVFVHVPLHSISPEPHVGAASTPASTGGGSDGESTPASTGAGASSAAGASVCTEPSSLWLPPESPAS
jgi:hypothetical protein